MKNKRTIIFAFLAFIVLPSLVFSGGRPPGNRRPRVQIDPVPEVVLPHSNRADLNATVTDDGRPNPPGQVTVTWSRVFGPAPVTFIDPNSEDTQAVFTEPGAYRLRLTASDSARSTRRNVDVQVRRNQRPTADAGPDQTLTDNNGDGFEDVTLDGSNSFDPDGTIVEYKWADPTFTNMYSSSSPFLVLNLPVGTHRYGLWVFDNEGLMGDDILGVTITILPKPNDPPSVNAGSDETLKMRFSGTIGDRIVDGADYNVWQAAFGSTPGDPRWDFLADMDGNGRVGGEDFIIWQAAFGSRPGDPNWDPRADVNSGDPVTTNLNGEVRDDGLPTPPGQVTTTWSVVQSPGGQQPNIIDPNDLQTLIQFFEVGDYTLQLSAFDGEHTSTDTVKIFICNAIVNNRPPIVEAGADQTIKMPFSGAVGDGRVDERDFNVINAAMFSQPGDTNWDPIADINSDGGVDVSDFNIWNEAKFTNVGDPQYNVRADINSGSTVTAQLNGVVQDDGFPDPPAVVNSSWSVISGPGPVVFSDVTNPVTSATFSEPGIYILQLFSFDGMDSSTDTVQIFVCHAVIPNQAPIVDAGPSQTVVLGSTPTLNGTIIDDGLPNPPGQVSSTWTVISGPSSLTFAAPNSEDTLAIPSSTGTYVLLLTVTDGVFISSDTATLIVVIATNPVVNNPPVVSISGDTEITLPGSANVTASISDDNVFSLITTWSLFSGPDSVTFNNPTGLSTGIEFIAPGSYIIQFTVIDGTHTVVTQHTIEVGAAAGQGALAHDINILNPKSGQKAVINYVVPTGGANVEVTVYTIASEVVKVLLNSFQTGGPKTVEWAGFNGSGGLVSSGLYPFTVKIEEKVKKKSAISVIK